MLLSCAAVSGSWADSDCMHGKTVHAAAEWLVSAAPSGVQSARYSCIVSFSAGAEMHSLQPQLDRGWTCSSSAMSMLAVLPAQAVRCCNALLQGNVSYVTLSAQTETAKMVTVASSCLVSKVAVTQPSVLGSQKQVACDVTPAPLFCRMVVVTLYLKSCKDEKGKQAERRCL